MRAPAIALFLPSLDGGGAERVMLTLARGFIARGRAVDVVLARATGAFVDEVPDGARLVSLDAGRVLHSVPRLTRYLRRERPAALLSTLDTANVVAVLAAVVARSRARIVLRQANTMSRNARTGPRFLPALARLCYPLADRIVAVSEGVAADLAPSIGLSPRRVVCVPNPVVGPALAALAAEPPPVPWFASGEPPVVLAAGRLSAQKDFPTLLRAFARVRSGCPCRLVILGEGEDRGALEQLARELGVADAVELPGFARNPFAYMARARLFVLSSAWEGLPGVLIQALACGTPVVATDCESGPREILDGGRHGRLVPVGDADALARAISAALDEPKRAPAVASWRPFTEDEAVQRYLELLVGDADAPPRHELPWTDRADARPAAAGGVGR